MPGIRKKDVKSWKPFGIEIRSARKADEEVNNNNEGAMRAEMRRVDDGVYGGANGHARTHPSFQRSQTEPRLKLDWDKVDSRYTKIGKNGYRTKDVVEHLRHLSVNGIEISSESMKNGGGNSDVCDVHTYAGRRDVSDPSSVLEKQIVSSRGTVRGFKNRVRAGIATFIQQQEGNNQVNTK